MIDLTVEELPRDEPVGQLPPQPWMAWPETLAVMDALTTGGQEARFVGGCVRDSLLGRPVRDIDIATPDRPERVLARLVAAGLRAIPTGVAHGTVTAVVGDRHFEITTLRRDVEHFGRQAKVDFTADWVADSERRDFTINALYCRRDGAIFDPQDGLPDLASGRIRFVGKAMDRIEEDRLRLLRYFRFYAYYGKPPTDIDALAACRAHAPQVAMLSAERLDAELRKILLAPDPTATLLLMQGERVLAEIVPEAQWFGRLRTLVFLETRGLVRPSIQPDWLRRLAVLVAPEKVDAAQFASRFKWSRVDSGRFAALVALDREIAVDCGRQAARLCCYRWGAALFRDRVLMSWAIARDRTGHSSAQDSRDWMRLLDIADGWTDQRMPIRGQDIVMRGVPPGEPVGAILAALEAWWIDGDFAADRPALLARLDQMVLSEISGLDEPPDEGAW